MASNSSNSFSEPEEHHTSNAPKDKVKLTAKTRDRKKTISVKPQYEPEKVDLANTPAQRNSATGNLNIINFV